MFAAVDCIWYFNPGPVFANSVEIIIDASSEANLSGLTLFAIYNYVDLYQQPQSRNQGPVVQS